MKNVITTKEAASFLYDFRIFLIFNNLIDNIINIDQSIIKIRPIPNNIRIFSIMFKVEFIAIFAISIK